MEFPQITNWALTILDCVSALLVAAWFFQLPDHYAKLLGWVCLGLTFDSIGTRLVFEFFPRAEVHPLLHYGLRYLCKLARIIPMGVLFSHLYLLTKKETTK